MSTPIRTSLRRLAWLVLVVSSVLLLGSVAVVLVASGTTLVATPTAGTSRLGYPNTSNGRWNVPGPGMGGGMVGGMMGRRVWLAGDGVAVQGIAQARARATLAGSGRGLRPGEVMQFNENFYVELKDAAGRPATEVLVNPTDGSVSTEQGPAMMWNSGSWEAAVSSDRARAVADDWLRVNLPGQATVADVKGFPGYYTIDTESGGTIVGMLSVNALTGAVWYHTWHGNFVTEEDA